MSIVDELLERTDWGEPVECPTLTTSTYTGHMMFTFEAIAGGFSEYVNDDDGFTISHLYATLSQLHLEAGLGRAIVRSQYLVEIGELMFVATRYPAVFEKMTVEFNENILKGCLTAFRGVLGFETLGWVIVLSSEGFDFGAEMAVPIFQARTLGIDFDTFARGGMDLLRIIQDNDIDASLVRSVTEGLR